MPTKRTSPQPPVQRICAHCGGEFTVIPARLRKGGGKYCGIPCYVAYRTRPIEERFWEKVDKSGACWLWIGMLMKSGGYGQFTVGQMPIRAHRLAWEFLRGPIPEGMEVCHNCPDGDNPRCVNPDHLFLGTHAENMADMWQKGRGVVGLRHRGEAHHGAKLTDEQVREIRALLAAGVAKKAIARQFAVHGSTVHHIAIGRIWRHVD